MWNPPAPQTVYLQSILLQNLLDTEKRGLEGTANDSKYFLFHSCFKVPAKKHLCFKQTPKVAEMLVNLLIPCLLNQICIHTFNNEHFGLFGLHFFSPVIRVRYIQEDDAVSDKRRFFYLI